MDGRIESQIANEPEQAIGAMSAGLAEESDQLTYASGSSEGRLTARIVHHP